MRAGTLRHLITFERPDVTRNAFGEEIAVWVPVITMKAKVSPISGGEALRANREAITANLRIEVRGNPALIPMTTKWRARFGNDRLGQHILDLQYIRDVDMKGERYEILALDNETQG